uniref:Vacuolar sorting receptor thioredoxin-like domain-containing protein n=1 Tax=Oryza rufipogon TaxID=4529 RepID=A0A0E0NP39_ORYRU
MLHPDELWTNSNDECRPRCDEQAAFVGAFRGHAQLLEAALHHLVMPRRIPGDEAVQGAVHQPRPPRRLWQAGDDDFDVLLHFNVCLY